MTDYIEAWVDCEGRPDAIIGLYRENRNKNVFVVKGFYKTLMRDPDTRWSMTYPVGTLKRNSDIIRLAFDIARRKYDGLSEVVQAIDELQKKISTENSEW